MDLFSIDLTLVEIQLLRQSLDVITISGKDAKAIANLQLKLEGEIVAIQSMLKQAELQKQQELADAIEYERKKTSKGK